MICGQIAFTAVALGITRYDGPQRAADRSRNQRQRAKERREKVKAGTLRSRGRPRKSAAQTGAPSSGP